MALRAEGTNILIKLDNKTLDALILDAVIEREKYVNENMPDSHIHHDQVIRTLRKKYQNLEIDDNTVVDRLHALVEKGIVTSTLASPSYRFNPEYLMKEKKNQS